MAETETGAGAGAGKEVVLVTGCTPGGIGHAMAMEFAHMKCQVVATARSFSSLEALRTNAQVALHTVQLDVLSETSIEEAVRTVMDMYGRIDILVNNAGVHSVGPLAELPMELLQSTFNTNVFGTMQVIKAVVPHMASRRKGKIVNIGSVSVLVCNPWAGAYAASKAALHCLSDSLRVELKPFGIDVITVVPGAIKSNLDIDTKEGNIICALVEEGNERFRDLAIDNKDVLNHDSARQDTIVVGDLVPIPDQDFGAKTLGSREAVSFPQQNAMVAPDRLEENE
ncbi:hypothetical protein SUGI_1014160 [Cryptomeria japonica]|nr:hypothetical protein SUGI_1014160 [Cryptomeria japonica]